MNQRIFLLLCILALFSFETIARNLRGDHNDSNDLSDLNDFSDDDDQEYSFYEGEDDIIQGEIVNVEAADDMASDGSGCCNQTICVDTYVPRKGVQSICTTTMVCP